jgi:hypothetical protein
MFIELTDEEVLLINNALTYHSLILNKIAGETKKLQIDDLRIKLISAHNQHKMVEAYDKEPNGFITKDWADIQQEEIEQEVIFIFNN